MRIMYLTESTGWSGGAQQLLWMAEALQKRGHELTIGCQPGSDILQRSRAAGLYASTVIMRQDYDVPAAVAISRILKEKGIDILHAQHSTAHALGLIAAWLANIKVFAVTRRVTFPLKKHLFSRLKYLSKRINGYVAISEAVRDILVQAGVAPSRVDVIPSVVNAPVASPAEGQALRQELGLGLGRPVVTTVANYADFKGQDILVQAAAEVVKHLPQTQFLLAGRDTEKLQPMVDRLGLQSAVHLAGFRRDVPRLLAASDMFVLPSLQEAAGTALREAMAVGLPCVGTNVGGIPEALHDGQTGVLVPPADAPALARGILTLLQDPALAKRLAVNGRALVQENYGINSAADKMEQFYEKLIPV